VPAPEGIDGKNVLPLLTNPGGQIRDSLPLFNFWGGASAQSMAVVTPEWKYIYWYSAADGMKPTDELFHVGSDRYEMTNSAGDSNYAKELARMQDAYDAELTAMAGKVVKGHGYEPYPTLFNRTIPWDQKEPLLKDTKVKGAGEGEGEGGKKRNKKKSESKQP
jgi:arylsulfatase A-like enzyme